MEEKGNKENELVIGIYEKLPLFFFFLNSFFQ